MGLGRLLLVLLVAIATLLVVVHAKTFKPKRSSNGSSTCALANPTEVIPLSELWQGIPPGVPDAVRCGFGCERSSGCMSFNYRRSSSATLNGGQCELYTMFPRSCLVDEEDFCQYYQATDVPYQCQVYSDFSCIPGTSMYVQPIFEQIPWLDARQRCSAFGPSSHLVVFRSQLQYDSLSAYMNTSNLKAVSSCYWGYWTAKRRLDMYNATQLACRQSPFVWDTDNTTRGMLPEQDWESSMWCPGQPDCYVLPVLSQPESCVQITTKLTSCLNQTKLNDNSCSRSFCPLCQLDAE